MITKSAITLAVFVRSAAVDNKFESSNFAIPSVIVGIMRIPAALSAVSGVEIGTLGLADAYKSATTAIFLFLLYLSVYQNGITSFIKSALFRVAGSEVFIE